MPSPHSRRAVLAQCGVLLTGLSAGCMSRLRTGALSTSTTSGPSLSDRFDCSEAFRPEPAVPSGVEREIDGSDETRTEESIGSVEYPSPPSGTADSITVEQYAVAHERAYRRNERAAEYGEDLVGFGFSPHDRELVDRQGDIALVRVAYVFYENVVSDDVIVHGDSPRYVATYAVSDWGVARAVGGTADADDDLDPHPVEDGSLVACFDDADETAETTVAPAETFDCAEAFRPSPDVPAGVEREVTVGDDTRTVETVGSVSYPDPPDFSNNTEIRDYAVAHERAYVRNEHAAEYGRGLVQFSFGTRQEATVERLDGVAVVRFVYAYEYTWVDSESRLVAGHTGDIFAAYAIGEDGAARAVDGETTDDEAPHPIEDGSLVACFV